MSVETRGIEAAAALRAATRVDADRGLAELRRTHRRRSTGRVVVAVAAVAGVVGVGVVVLDGSVTKPQLVDRKPIERIEGVIIDSIGGDLPGTPPTKLAAATDNGAANYPVWAAFDQDSGRFLFGAHAIGGVGLRHLSTIQVLEPGLDAPVATIDCGVQCPAASVVGPGASFGPGSDEVTLMVEQGKGNPVTAHVYGFDGSLRDKVDLSRVLEDSGIADVEWSPDRSQLAVSTFTGSREAYCDGDPDCAARVWIINRATSDAELLFEQKMSGLPDPNPPLLTNLAWSPDGERLGMLSGNYYPETADPPQLLALDAVSGRVSTIYEFDDCGVCNPLLNGFAWSPDGTRIAVTSGDSIDLLTTDGTTVGPAGGEGKGPLAWLAGTSE